MSVPEDSPPGLISVRGSGLSAGRVLGGGGSLSACPEVLRASVSVGALNKCFFYVELLGVSQGADSE